MGRHTLGGISHVHAKEHSYDSHVTLQAMVDVAGGLPVSFLVLTDHETAQPLEDVRARYQDGVLVLGGTEWSPDDGHLVDLSPTPGKGPYKWMKDALADCKRRGGPCVASHPSAWRRRYHPPLTGVDGVEVHSSMTAVGNQVVPPYGPLLWTAFQLLLNPGLGLWRYGTFQPDAVELWESYAQLQPLAAWCGADVHGMIPVRENMLAFMTLVSLEEPLSTDALVAASQLRSALMHGVCVNQLAGFVDGLTLEPAGDAVTSVARIQRPVGPARLMLIHNGKTVATTALQDGREGRVSAPVAPGPWRAVVEVDAPGLLGGITQSAAVALRYVNPP